MRTSGVVDSESISFDCFTKFSYSFRITDGMWGANILKRTVYVGGLDEQVPFLMQAFLLLVVEIFVMKGFRIDGVHWSVCFVFIIFIFVFFNYIEVEQGLERHRKDKDILYMPLCWYVVFFFKGFARYSCRKSDGLLSRLCTCPPTTPSWNSCWMAQDGQLPVVVLRYISVPKINKEELKFTFFPNPKHDLGIGNRSHPILPGRSQGLGRGLRALWRTENRWRAKLNTQEAAARGQV